MRDLILPRPSILSASLVVLLLLAGQRHAAEGLMVEVTTASGEIKGEKRFSRR